MNRRATLAAAMIVATGVAGLTPALAAKAKPKPKPKPLAGTWSYTDLTADPSDTALAEAGKHPYCHDALPPSPADVNAHALKVAGKGLLAVAGTHTGDWAMEVDDAKGNPLATSDGGSPNDQEGTIVDLPKAGTYSVLYCNLTGAPTATAKYKFTYK
jgi:hypothetical protein